MIIRIFKLFKLAWDIFKTTWKLITSHLSKDLTIYLYRKCQWNNKLIKSISIKRDIQTILSNIIMKKAI